MPFAQIAPPSVLANCIGWNFLVRSFQRKITKVTNIEKVQKNSRTTVLWLFMITVRNGKSTLFFSCVKIQYYLYLRFITITNNYFRLGKKYLNVKQASIPFSVFGRMFLLFPLCFHPSILVMNVTNRVYMSSKCKYSILSPHLKLWYLNAN